MSDDDQAPTTEPIEPTTPTEPIEQTSKSRKGIAIVLAALLVVVVGTGAWALFAFTGSSDVLAAKAPADSLVFATIYLDPAAGQKTNLANIASQFPGGAAVSDGAASALSAAVEEMGLDWETDVKPWIGSQMAITVLEGGAEPTAAFLIDTTDAGKAEASLQKMRASSDLEGLEWSSADANGVTISVGTMMGLPDPVMTYAVTGDTVIISPSLEATKKVIATIQGEADDLTANADYAETMSGLPEDTLAQVYVSIPTLFKLVAQEAGGMTLPGGASPLDQFEAYRGMGMSLAAESDGIAMEFTVLTDPAKLTEAQKQAASVAPHKNAALQYTPEDSYGIFSMTNLDGTLQSLTQIVTGSATSGTGGGTTETGSPADAILKEITDATSGDAAISVSPGTEPERPGGMLMIATDDQAAMEGLLQQLTTLITATMPADPATGGGGWTEQDHDGTTLHTLSGVGELADSGIAPTWAVTEDMALIGTTPDEVSASLDAKSSGTTIEQQPNYQAAIAHADEMNSGMLYVDVQSITDVVADSITDTTDAASFRTAIAPIKAVIMTGTTGAERSTQTVFVLIEQ